MAKGSINIIACIDIMGAIGFEGGLPWPRIPADMGRFRTLTRGGTIVCGRRTWGSISQLKRGATPRNYAVVCSEGADLGLIEPDVRLHVAGSSGLHGVLATAMECGAIRGDVWICGGARIYEEALAFADRVYLTALSGRFRADTFWPLHLLDPALRCGYSADDVILPHWKAMRPPELIETPFGLEAWALDLERI